MPLKYQAPRGTRDLLPEEIGRWQWAEARARGVLERYSYAEIRTPEFEESELFARTSGETSDLVQKEMYRFRDLKGRDLALRPEGTAGVCRAYLERNLAARGRVHKLCYLGPMFRYGRPQKGRFRQFFQVGAEIIGTPAAAADVEMVTLFVDLFRAWGFTGLTVALNSVGTPATREEYARRLREWLAPVRERLSADSQKRLEVNPLRVLDSKDEGDRALLEGRAGAGGALPRMLDVLDPESRAHWEQVLAGLAALDVRCEIDHGLVRGLDYYTRTAFEVHDRSLGAQSALGGGGRYDGLIEALGGPPTPGVGFSIGLDRVLLALADRAVTPPAPAPRVCVAGMEESPGEVASLARALRAEFVVDYDFEARSLSTQLKAADRGGARVAVLLGAEEWGRGEVLLRDLATKAQRAVPRGEIAAQLRAMLGSAPEVSAR